MITTPNTPTAGELAEFTLAQQAPITRRWADDAARLPLLTQDHQLDIEMLTDLEFAQLRRDRFASDQPVELFLNEWQQLRPGLHVMLSMRYEGGDPRFPFVEASATSTALTDPSEIAATAAAAAERYRPLRPAYLRWWSCAAAGAIEGTGQDKRFLAAPLAELTAAEVPQAVTLQPSVDLEHYADAEAAYAAVDTAHPDHPRQARIESRTDLEELQRDGLLYDVLVDDHWSGYVAAEAEHKLGLSGFTVSELILTEPVRGHGLGRHLTTLLARRLLEHGKPDDILIGTIHHDNTGALRAAGQAGRHDIGGWLTYRLA